MTSATLYPTKDAHVDTGSPADNFGFSPYHIIGEIYSASPFPRAVGVCRAWYGFDLSSIPASATINSASFRLNVFWLIDAYGPEQYNVQRSTDLTWTELGITANNAPNGTMTGSEAFFNTEGAGGLFFTDVKTMVQAALADAAITLRVRNDQENGHGIAVTDRFYGGASIIPALIIDYTAVSRRRGHTMFAG